MACAGCAKRYVAPLTNPSRPPVGGWSLIGLPPSVSSEDASRINQPARGFGGRDAQEAIQRVTGKLRRNRIPISEVDVRKWAEDQWCSRDPGRCPGRIAGRADSKPVMAWARSFWEGWNQAITNATGDDTIRVNVQWAEKALDRLAKPDGCESCLAHWQDLLELFPPANATNQTDARVWLWFVHNESREGLPITPYSTIAAQYKWADLGAARINQIIQTLRIA